MLKLINIKQDDTVIKATVLVEGDENRSFDISFDRKGNIVSSTANNEQKCYEAQARIAFKKHIGKPIPEEIASMWY